MERIGIDNLKIALVAAINFGESIEKNLDDGKITLAEALGIGAGHFGDIVRVLKNGTKIKAEFLDLDESERLELVELVKDELDLNNEHIEVIIEKAIEMLLSIEGLINYLKN